MVRTYSVSLSSYRDEVIDYKAAARRDGPLTVDAAAKQA
jgi:hypothetical protein